MPALCHRGDSTGRVHTRISPAQRNSDGLSMANALNALSQPTFASPIYAPRQLQTVHTIQHSQAQWVRGFDHIIHCCIPLVIYRHSGRKCRLSCRRPALCSNKSGRLRPFRQIRVACSYVCMSGEPPLAEDYTSLSIPSPSILLVPHHHTHSVPQFIVVHIPHSMSPAKLTSKSPASHPLDPVNPEEVCCTSTGPRSKSI